jgi:hypothetical protein
MALRIQASALFPPSRVDAALLASMHFAEPLLAEIAIRGTFEDRGVYHDDHEYLFA